VLFYGRVFELVEETYEVFLRAIGFDVDAAMRLEGLTTPVVHADADFARPIRVGDEITVRLAVSRIGASSFTMEYAFLGADGVTSATARVTHVAIEAPDWRARPLPDDLRTRLDPYLGPR
jgi:acyl-CoA thioesterase FadM